MDERIAAVDEFDPEALAAGLARLSALDAFRSLVKALPKDEVVAEETINFFAQLDQEIQGALFLGFLKLATRTAYRAVAGIDFLCS